MHAAFALTKIQPPRLRPGLIARPSLEQQLTVALGTARLVLVSAPAGFGKTAAITRQLARLPEGTAVAWIAADADDDLPRMAACLVAALDPFDLPWRTSPDALVAALDGSRVARQAFAAALLDALASTDVSAGVLVVDDLHRVADAAVAELLDDLLAHLPAHWCLLVASRVDPPLALARLRALGELAEVRQDDLRFTREEVHHLARTAARPWSDDELAQLAERTQGWAAGLRLAMQQSPAAGGAPGGSLRDRHVFDYLASEVLDGLAPALRTFLLRSAVLPVLSPSRCAAVTGDASAARWLDEIERRGLFVSVRDADEAGEPVLCLHDLFRDFLDERLRLEQPDELAPLLRRAAAGEPDTARRVGYLARAGDWAEAELTLYALAPSLLAAGAVLPLRHLLAQFPAERRERSARLQHLHGLCAWAHWDLLTMCPALERAAAGHAADGRPVDAQRALVLLVLGLTAGGLLERSAALLEPLRRQQLDAWTAVVAHQAGSWHALAHSRMHDVAPALDRMMDRVAPEDDPALWLQCVPLASFVGLPGAGAPIRRYIDGALRLTSPDTPSPLRVLALALQAAQQLWRGDTDAALATLRSVEDDSRWLGHPPNLSGYLGTFSALAWAVRGDHDAALAAARTGLDSLDDERTSGRRTVWFGHMLFFQARIAAMLDDDETFRTLAARLAAHHNPDERAIFLRERASLPARLAALDGDWPQAAALYAGALVDEEGLDLYGQAVEVRVRFAHALLACGQVHDAAAALRPVFARVAASGEAGALRFAGPRAVRALAGADWQQWLSAGEVALLQGAAGAPPHRVARPAPSGALSAREHDVLARMAAGDSNKLLARAFDLSPHTVKRHVANILDKLQVSSRGQAAAWYLARPQHRPGELAAAGRQMG